VGVVIRETLFSMIRVHINIVHDYGPNAHGSLIVGQQPGQSTIEIIDKYRYSHAHGSFIVGQQPGTKESIAK
jgi:hypothetical protein